MATMARSILLLLTAIIPFTMASSSHELVERQANSQPVNFGAPKSQSFVTQFGGSSSSLSFTITASNMSDGDIHFRMAAPTHWSWVGIGIGNQMAGSLMFVMYQGVESNTVLSPRLATGHHEPIYAPLTSVNFTQFTDSSNSMGYTGDVILNGITSGMMYATGICHGCQKLAVNQLSTTNTKQNFIYAAGAPGRNPNSNSLSAPLREHLHFGYFTMDMTQAVGIAVPALGNSSSTATTTTGDTTDDNYLENAHAFFMLLSVMILIPVGLFMVRVLERVKIHFYVQSAAVGLIFVGFICGCINARLYERTKNFNSAHQIIGIVVVLAFIAQWVLGFLSHRNYMKTGFPLEWAMKPHKYGLGTVAFGLAMANASLGLSLALASKLNIIYWPVMAVILILLFVSYMLKSRIQRKWGPKKMGQGLGSAAAPNGNNMGGPPAYSAPPVQGAPAGYQPPNMYNNNTDGGSAWGTRSDIALENMHHTRSESREPPPYDLEPTKPREFA